MRCVYTAILQLREAGPVLARDMLEKLLRPLRGVREVGFEPADSLVTVRFDRDLTGLAEIVRTIEDGGSIVSSVAQRPVPLTSAGQEYQPMRAAHGAGTGAAD